MSYFQKIDSYVREAYEELLHKVSWPTWEELQQTTAIVIVALGLVHWLLPA